MSLSRDIRNRGTSVRRWLSVVQIASSQWGVVAHRQLREHGVGNATISRWTGQGRLHPRYLGVYAVGHPALPVEGELVAALFRAGNGATLSHETALWWWGLAEEPPPEIHISVSGRHKLHEPGIRVHHPRALDRTWHRRLPVTTVARTLLDVASSVRLARVRRALADAEFHGLIDLDEVDAVLRRGCPGSARLRAALRIHRPELAFTRSELERRFFELWESTGLPMPEVNVLVCGYLVDALWREQRVVVELDGHRAHRSPAQLERDHARDLTLRGVGLEVRRYTWHQVTRQRELVEADLVAAVRGHA
jgi:predicted transcriptional regulator of viral defense system